MKNKLLIIFFILCNSSRIFSQNYYDINFDGSPLSDWGYELYIDSTSNPGNVWQIGPPQKTVFTSAFSVPNVIVTDTLNYYPINDTSSFILKHVANFGFSMPAGVSFGGEYFVNSDTLTDFGKIEFSPNNGSTWIDLLDPAYASYVYWNNPYVQPVFTGNSNGWKHYQASIETLGPLFNIQNNDTVLFRFTFISDGIQTNKDGLMFDSIYMWDCPPIGIANINSTENTINAYPNPSNTIITIEFEKSRSKERVLNIYNNIGRIVDEIMIPINENKISIDINCLPDGIYLYSLINKDGYKTSSGKFLKNK